MSDTKQPAEGLEVTKEMIAAAVEAAADMDVDSGEEVFIAIYKAMRSAERAAG